mmetsp:Transcript_8702/g.24507  ORF Transcript_8702/g.24507 Transcript_8702/m.24507 type:complete len:261 (+) Transcript_8702:1571-2353(+)
MGVVEGVLELFLVQEGVVVHIYALKELLELRQGLCADLLAALGLVGGLALRDGPNVLHDHCGDGVQQRHIGYQDEWHKEHPGEGPHLVGSSDHDVPLLKRHDLEERHEGGAYRSKPFGDVLLGVGAGTLSPRHGDVPAGRQHRAQVEDHKDQHPGPEEGLDGGHDAAAEEDELAEVAEELDDPQHSDHAGQADQPQQRYLEQGVGSGVRLAHDHGPSHPRVHHAQDDEQEVEERHRVAHAPQAQAPEPQEEFTDEESQED